MTSKAISRSSLFVASAHGVLYAALSALFAEFVLMNFLRGTTTLSSIARVSIGFITIYTIYRFASASLTRFKRDNRDVMLLTAVTLCSILVIWLFRIIFIGLATNARSSTFAASLTPESFYFAVPYAAGALILQALLGLHYGLVFAVTLAVLVGLYTPGQPIFVPYVLACNLVACLSLSRFRSRSAYIKAGLNVSIIALPFALAFVLLRTELDVAQVIAAIGGALLSGVLCTFIAAGLTPIVEYLGGYVTDMRLIEMATLDHPLLKELSIQAPGTWNHSMVMGMMVESAADAVGANTVLARVGAYFHDVGKLRKPLYFVENQFGEENRHDKLSTSMSALIIRSHVKDGIDLARKHGLPEPIVDMIPQHHGTSLIEYFYEKACRELKEEDESESTEVDRSLYTYPGPKPQTREAGILMLADSIEAAARTLSEPTADRIQGMVQKLINKIFASGELNECELTLQDLHRIAKCFTRVLTGIYHQRIAYAEPAEKTSERAPLKLITTPPEDETESADGVRTKAEDLKRLGM